MGMNGQKGDERNGSNGYLKKWERMKGTWCGEMSMVGKRKVVVRWSAFDSGDNEFGRYEWIKKRGWLGHRNSWNWT